MSTLYELTADMEILKQMMDEDPDNEVILDTLEGLEGEIEIKAEGYCKVIAEYVAEMEVLKKEEERLYDKRKRAEQNTDRLKSALLTAMKVSEKYKINTGLFSLSLRNNPVSLDEVPEKLPKKYMIAQAPKIDRKLLLSDVKHGVRVKGVTIKQTQSLTIR